MIYQFRKHKLNDEVTQKNLLNAKKIFKILKIIYF